MTTILLMLLWSHMVGKKNHPKNSSNNDVGGIFSFFYTINSYKFKWATKLNWAASELYLTFSLATTTGPIYL